MRKITVDPGLGARVRDAVSRIHHFETIERHVLRELLDAAERGAPIDALYVDVANRALASRDAPPAAGEPAVETAHA